MSLFKKHLYNIGTQIELSPFVLDSFSFIPFRYLKVNLKTYQLNDMRNERGDDLTAFAIGQEILAAYDALKDREIKNGSLVF